MFCKIIVREMDDNMRVITLCGSAKFKHQFELVNAFLTRQGNIVISPFFLEQSDRLDVTQEQAECLNQLPFQKIDISDELFVVDVGGYIGNRTRKQIEYAEKNGKVIRYYSSYSDMPCKNQQMDVWAQALKRIEGTMEYAPYMTWFHDTTATYDGDRLIVHCPNDFTKEWLYGHYSHVILNAVEQVTGNDKVKIGFQSFASPAESHYLPI